MKAKEGGRARGTAGNGAQEVRPYMTGAETWGPGGKGAYDRG